MNRRSSLEGPYSLTSRPYSRFWAVLAVLIGLTLFLPLVARTASAQGALPGYDWCFQFDFTANDYDIAPTFGTYDGGFKSDNAGFVGFVYSQARNVQPAQVVITFERRTLDDSQVIDVQASANIFGIGHTPDPALFTFDTEASGGEFEDVQFMLLTPQSAGQNGTSMFVSAQSNQPIAITAVDVYGYGISPFTGLPGIESCSTATATASPSPTFAYADCALWDQEFDFEASGQGFYTIGPGAYQSGSGWQPGLESGGRHLDMALQMPGTLQIGRVDYEIFSFPGASNAVLFFVGDTPETAQYLGGASNITGSGIVSRTINGSASGNKLYVYSDNMYTAGGGGGPSYIVKSITIYGTGVNPYTGEYVSCDPVTPTPLPSTCLLPGQPTPTQAATNDPNWTYTVDFEEDEPTSVGWAFSTFIPGNPQGTWTSGVGVQAVDGRTFTGSPNLYSRKLQVSYAFPASATITSVTAEFDYTLGTFESSAYWYFIGYGSLTAQPTSGSTNGANTKTLSGTQSGVTSLSVSVRSSHKNDTSLNGAATLRTVTVTGTGYNPFTGETGSTPTPLPSCTSTPAWTPTGTIVPSATPTPFTLTPTPSRTPTRTPIPLILPTLASTSTPRPATGTPNPLTPTATVINLEPSATTTFALPGSGSGAGQPNPFESAGDIRYMGESVIAYGSNAWRKSTGWVQGFSSTASGLINAWGTTPAVMPPGLPQCVTDPLISQLCAIWWILENTLFSGTLGGIIIDPIAVSIVYMLAVFQFIKLVRGILYRVGEIRK